MATEAALAVRQRVTAGEPAAGTPQVSNPEPAEAGSP